MGELRRTGATVTFAVLDANPDPALFPATGDSVWIDPAAELPDPTGNTQTNPANRRVLLRVKTASYAWSVNVAPNPFTPANSPVADRLPPIPALADNGIAFVAGSTLPIAENVRLTGRVLVYDALADLVCEAPMVEQGRRLYWVWDGYNRHGRKVGTGTYLAVVRVSENGKRVVERRVLVGVNR